MPVLAAALPAITAVAGLAGAGLSAAGAIEGGEATAANDRYRAKVAENNAILAKQNGTWAIQAGETHAANEGLRTRARIGTEKATQGASGIDVNSGSAVATRAGTQSMGLLDAMTIRSNASRQAYGYAVKAASDTAEGQLETEAAGQAETAGEISAGAGLLAGASSVGGKYAGYLTTAREGGTPGVTPSSGDGWSGNGTWDR